MISLRSRWLYLSIVCSLSGAVTQATAAAGDAWQAAPIYIGTTLGQARGSVNAQQMDAALAARGYSADVQVDHLNRGAWSAFAGYRWSRYLSAELGFTDLGEVTTRVTGSPADVADFLRSANSVQPRSAKVAELSLLAQYPLTQNLGFFVRGGLTSADSVYRADSREGSTLRSGDEREFTYAAGVNYDLSQRWAMRGSWQRYNIEDEAIDFIGASLIYTFGSRRASAVAAEPAVVSHRPLPAPADEVPTYLAEPVTMELEVQFATASAEVAANYLADIERVAEFLRQYPDAHAEIEGHTDARGSAVSNLLLSQRRASAVRAILIERMGVSASRVTAVGYGETRLRELGETAQAHRANRRVIATITSAAPK